MMHSYIRNAIFDRGVYCIFESQFHQADELFFNRTPFLMAVGRFSSPGAAVIRITIKQELCRIAQK
jgi:hypothetical protein